MIKVLACAFLTLPLMGYSQKPKEILFAFRDMPSTVGYQTITERSYDKMRWYGSEKQLQRLKEKNVKATSMDSVVASRKLTFTSGPANKESEFPLTIECTESTTTGLKTNFPKGTVIYGRGKTDRATILDSIAAPGLSEPEKLAAIDLMRNGISALFFPARKMKVGDTLTTRTLIHLSVFNTKLNLLFKRTYQLTQIGEEVAEFITMTEISLIPSSSSQFDIRITGGGSGTMSYDFVGYKTMRTTSDLEMKFDFKLLEDLGCEAISVSSSSTEYRARQ